MVKLYKMNYKQSGCSAAFARPTGQTKLRPHSTHGRGRVKTRKKESNFRKKLLRNLRFFRMSKESEELFNDIHNLYPDLMEHDLDEPPPDDRAMEVADEITQDVPDEMPVDNDQASNVTHVTSKENADKAKPGRNVVENDNVSKVSEKDDIPMKETEDDTVDNMDSDKPGRNVVDNDNVSKVSEKDDPLKNFSFTGEKSNDASNVDKNSKEMMDHEEGPYVETPTETNKMDTRESQIDEQVKQMTKDTPNRMIKSKGEPSKKITPIKMKRMGETTNMVIVKPRRSIFDGLQKEMNELAKNKEGQKNNNTAKVNEIKKKVENDLTSNNKEAVLKKNDPKLVDYPVASSDNSESEISDSSDDDIEHHVEFTTDKKGEYIVKFHDEPTENTKVITKRLLKAGRSSIRKGDKLESWKHINTTKLEKTISRRNRYQKRLKRRDKDAQRERKECWKDIKQRYELLEHGKGVKIDKSDILKAKMVIVAAEEKEKQEKNKKGVDNNTTSENQTEAMEEDHEQETEVPDEEIDELLKSSPRNVTEDLKKAIKLEGMKIKITPSKDPEAARKGSHDRTITISDSDSNTEPTEKVSESINDILTRTVKKLIFNPEHDEDDPEKKQREANNVFLKKIGADGEVEQIMTVDKSIIGVATGMIIEAKEKEFRALMNKVEEERMSKNMKDYLLRQFERLVTRREIQSEQGRSAEDIIEDSEAERAGRLEDVKKIMNDQNVFFFPNGTLPEDKTIQGFTELGLKPDEYQKSIEARVTKIIDAIPNQTANWNTYSEILKEMFTRTRDYSWHSDLKKLLLKMGIFYTELAIREWDNQGPNHERVHHNMYMCILYDIVATSSPKRYSGMKQGKMAATREVNKVLMDYLAEVYEKEGLSGMSDELRRIKEDCDEKQSSIKYKKSDEKITSIGRIGDELKEMVLSSVQEYNYRAPKAKFMIPTHKMNLINIRDLSRELCNDFSASKEARFEENDEIWKIFWRCSKYKQICKIQVVDRATWRKSGKKILNEIEGHLASFPLAVVDREYAGGLDQLGVVCKSSQRAFIKVYIFRLGFPESIRHLLLNDNLIVTGDGSSIVNQLGSFPSNFMDLATYTLDIPNVDKNNKTAHRMGVEGRARNCFGLDLSQVKDVASCIRGKNKLGRDRCDNGGLKALGFYHLTTLQYAALDVVIDCLNALLILGLTSLFLIKQHFKLSKYNRLEIIFRYMKKDWLMNKTIRPINPNQDSFHEGLKHWKDKKLAEQKVYIPVIKGMMSPTEAYEEDNAIGKIVVQAQFDNHKTHRGVKELVKLYTGIELGKRNAPRLTGGTAASIGGGATNPGKSYGQKFGGINFNLDSFNELSPEDQAFYTKGYTPLPTVDRSTNEVVEVDKNEHLNKAAKEMLFTIQNEGHLEFERDEAAENDDLPNYNMSYNEAVYVLEQKFRQHEIQEACDNEKRGIIKRIIELESEGKGLKMTVKTKCNIWITNLLPTQYIVNIGNIGLYPVFVYVLDEQPTKVLVRIDPKKTFQIKVDKKDVENGAKMMMWSTLTDGLAVGAEEVFISDYHPDLKNLRKRAHSDTTQDKSTSYISITIDDEDEDVFEATNKWATNEAKKYDGKAETTFKSDSKRHKSCAE